MCPAANRAELTLKYTGNFHHRNKCTLCSITLCLISRTKLPLIVILLGSIPWQQGRSVPYTRKKENKRDIRTGTPEMQIDKKTTTLKGNDLKGQTL